LAAQGDTLQSTWESEHFMVTASQVLTAQSAVVEHAAPPKVQADSRHVPAPQSSCAVQVLRMHPGSVGVLQMLLRLAHFSGAVSGMSPQQSALLAQSLTRQLLPVPIRSKSDGWHDLLAQLTPTGQSRVTTQDKSSAQSLVESQDVPRSPFRTLSSAAPPSAEVVVPPLPPLGLPAALGVTGEASSSGFCSQARGKLSAMSANPHNPSRFSICPFLPTRRTRVAET
jgi:hypothetical protein